MCTVTFSYDNKNEQAQQQLAALLSTGLFMQVGKEEELNIDFTDPQLFEDDNIPLPLDRNLSLDELEQLVVADIRSICKLKDAI